MRRKSGKTIALLLIVCIAASVAGLGTLIAYARSMAEAERLSYMKTDSPMDKEPVVITAEKGANEAAGAGSSCGYQQLLDGDDWLLSTTKDGSSKVYTVSVPSSISGALSKIGEIEDPTVGRNDAAAKELGNKNWYYKKVFNYSGSGKNVFLCFDGVADRMEVTLNGVSVGSHQGMFGGPYIDVSDVIKKGENTLTVRLKPVINYTQTVVFNCSYAWHYADLPPIGIWNSVRIEDRSNRNLDHPFITTVSHETGTVDLSVDITAASDQKVSGTLYCTISPKNFTGESCSFTYTLPAASETGDRNIRLRFDIPDFKLWWPRGYGEQNLYTMETLFVGSDGSRSYDSSDFGIRTLKLIATGRKEAANMYNRTAVFNGKTVFLKGANWCTIDAEMHFTREDYDRILCRAYDMGLNVFRSWGGGMVETEDFYDLCDEYGICVYQEWPCCWDSQKTQPKDVLYETVILNTKRIRNRASLLVYGGGNEGEATVDDKIMNEIGTLTYKYDGTRDFWRQDGGVGAYGIVHNHIHWGGEDPENYAEIYYNFTSNLHEYGLDAMMNLESVAKFATAEEMAEWPINPEGTIAYHTATFNGMKGWTQTPYGYDIDTFIHYASQFVEVNDLESLVTGSQIAQMMADYFAAFNSRINFPNQSMVMFYKFNDVYPGASWSVVDYYGTPKMAYWFMQDAYAPLTAGLKADRYDTYNKSDKTINFPVYVLDDADELSGSSWEVTVKAYNNYLKLVKEESYKGEGSVSMNKNLGSFALTAEQTDSAPLFLVTTLFKDGRQVARNYMFMNSGKDPGCLYAIPAADVTYNANGNTVTVKNNSDIPAVAVNFDVGSNSDTFRPADNFFWLEPGETYTFTVNDANAIKGLKGFNLLDKNAGGSAPSAPQNVKAVSNNYDTITLTWDKPKNAANLRYYELYIGGKLSALIKSSATSYTVEDLSEITEYTLELVAVDGGMNSSDRSKAVKCTTAADNNPPFVTKFTMTGDNTATVVFNRKVDPESASITDYYVLNFGAKVISAVPGADGYSVDLTFEGVDGNLSGRTITVIGVKDTSAKGNRAVRSSFKLDNTLVGYWSFDSKSKVLKDESNYHTLDGKATDAKYVDGVSGSAIKPTKTNIILSETDITFKKTVISFWFKGTPGSFDGFKVLIAKGSKVTGHFEIYANGGELKLYCPELCDSSFGVNLNKYAGKWTHFAFSYNGTELVCRINGEKAGGVKIKNDISARNMDLVLGSLPGGEFMVDGEFDDVMLVRTANAEAVVKSIFEGTYLGEIKFEKALYRTKPETGFNIKVLFENVDSNMALTWESSDETVATVDQSGKVTALSEGTALITVSSSSGRFVERCVVEVGDFKEDPAQTASSGPSPVLFIVLGCAAVLIAAAVIAAVVLVRKRKAKKN